MPKTKFQGIIFGIIMVIVMVYGMVCYNAALNSGGMQPSTFLEGASHLPLTALIAFAVETIFVGALAKKCALRMVNPRTEHPFHMILAVSSATVGFMCPIMSFIATLLFNNPGNVPEFISTWVQTLVINFPMAFFWQIFVAGPFVRFIFRLIFERKNSSGQEEV